MRHTQTVVIGTGRVACECVQVLLEHTNRIVMIEPEIQPFSTANAMCKKAGIQHHVFTKRDRISAYFSAIATPALVISAHNNYIFPPHIVENPALTIVNFHNSLLPRHAGRNAPSWAIYEMESIAGISWHRIAIAVDSGDLIEQRSVPIASDETAYSLTKKLADLGVECFRGLAPQLLENNYSLRPQPPDAAAKLHFSHEVPNDGILDLSWSIEKTHAFLRSLDYGKLEIAPAPRVRVLGSEFAVATYRMTPNAGPGDFPRFDMSPERLTLNDGIRRITITLNNVSDSESCQRTVGQESLHE